MSKVYFSGRELIMEGAELLFGSFRNFSGAKGRYNAEGQRSFNVQVEPEFIPMLEEVGINVKYFRSDLEDEDQEEKPGFFRVKVNYDGLRPPVAYVRYGEKGKFVELTAETIGQLDHAVFDNVDLILNPSHYEVNGSSGTSLYLNKGYFTLHVDPLAAKYEKMMQDGDAEISDMDEEVPFT